MPNIKEIALKISHEMQLATELVMGDYNKGVTDFAEALIAELAKGNEPVGWFKYDKVSQCWHPQYEEYADRYAKEQGWKKLYTLPPTASQIEQETAEAIAKMLENGSFLSQESMVALAANGAAKAIRSGAWKEFKK